MSTIVAFVMVLFFIFICWGANKIKDYRYQILAAYALAFLSCGGILWVNFFYIDNPTMGVISIVLVIIPNAITIFKDYSKLVSNIDTDNKAHYCASIIISIIFCFSIGFSVIEILSPHSFSNITSTHWLDRTIDFIYFSVTTFTTVGFGDITPQTTLARAIVTVEIIIAFVMLVLIINFFVIKKDNDKKDK